MLTVVDASVVLGGLLKDFPGQDQERLDRALIDALHEGAIAPKLLDVEVANVLIRQRRQGRLTDAGLIRLLARYDQMRIDKLEIAGCGALVSSGTKHGLTGYDSAYFSLALVTASRLATMDSGLAAAAAREHIELVVAAS